MNFIETINEYINEIILGVTSVGLMSLLLYALRFIPAVFSNIIKPAIDTFKNETNDKLAPMEKQFDTICKSLALLFEDKADSPITTEYKKEQYLQVAKELRTIKNINVVNEILNVTDKVENLLDNTVDKTKSFIDRNKG